MKNRSWILLFSVLLAVLLGIVLFQKSRSSGQIANVYQDNVCIRSIDLSQIRVPETFTVEDRDGHRNVIAVEPGRICVTEANCPDHICIQTGWISGGTKPIVCLPARLVIRIETEDREMDVDGVTG